ncbi:MAG: nuclear transport factor 2 family protein [Chthoniobacterales bacterium]
MRTLFSLVVLAGAMTLQAQTPAPDAAELTKLLNDFLAGASRNDIAAHERFWADDLIYTGSSGRRIGKADILRDVREEAAAPKTKEPETIFSAEEIRIQQYGTTAIVAFRLVGKTEKNGARETKYYLNSGTFLKRDGKWQVVNWQATIVPDKSGVKEIAERYVHLVLAMGGHDPDYVDAFYGPAEWKSQAGQEKKPLYAIGNEAKQAREQLDKIAAPSDELERLRRDYLSSQLSALEARVHMMRGEKLTFDEESSALYDAAAPTYPEAHFDEILKQLEARLPGSGPLWQRYEAWHKPFMIPKEKLDAVFQLAIAECRRRTLAHVQLPPNESFTVEYVTNKPWGGYNWYKGDYHSIIQVNTDLPIYIDRAIDLAAHEGYPGHHVYNALLEKNLVRDRGWPEFSVYALFSPQSLIAEGTANYGREVAFTKAEKLKFERDVLYPAAGIDPSRVQEYSDVQELMKQLAFAGNEAARKLVNGEIDEAAAEAWLQKYTVADPARAKQRIQFIKRYRSYVINYNTGEELVKQYIEKRGGTDADPEKRWHEFEQLLASPRLPDALR